MRKFRGHTHVVFSDLLGISVTTLQRLEKDDPRIEREVYARAAALLKLEFDWKALEVKPPPDLPREAFEARKFEVIRVPARTYAALEEMAGERGIPELLESFIANQRVNIKPAGRSTGAARKPAQPPARSQE